MFWSCVLCGILPAQRVAADLHRMKYSFIVFLFLFLNGHAQTGNKLYSPLANAQRDIAGIINKAKAEKKNILIQAGGNWCNWCIEFDRFVRADPQIDSLINTDYILYHLNYSPENKNLSILAKYKFPQRFGFPVFIVLNENGDQVHTQNSAYLEQGRSYNKAKVIEFLRHWNRAALDPAGYKNY